MSNFTILDTEATLADALPTMISHGISSKPALYIDLEGVSLSRRGTISIIQIYVHPLSHTYLIDVHKLGPAAFTTSKLDTANTSSLHTLKDVLESPSVPKCFFDVRRDADAIYNLFGVSMKNIIDIQLLELATRSGGRRRMVNGLARCITSDAGLSSADCNRFQLRKKEGVRLFAPEHGGSYEVFNERPLRLEVLEYCIQDVAYLPTLWAKYNNKLGKRWREKVRLATEERLRLALSPTFTPNGKHMALGPW